MGKKFLKIAIITVLLACVCATIANAYSFTATMTPSSTTVAESKEFSVQVKVSNLDVGTNGINSLSGYFKYDNSVFETITESSIDGLNSWGVTFNADNGKITLTKTTFVKQEEAVFQVTLKTKEKTAGKEANISFGTIVASNSEREISTGDISTTISVVSESAITTDPIYSGGNVTDPIIVSSNDVTTNPSTNDTTTNPSTNSIIITPGSTTGNTTGNTITITPTPGSTTGNTTGGTTGNTANNISGNTTINGVAINGVTNGTVNGTNNNVISQYVNRTSNTPTNSDIPYAGVEDTIVYILAILVVVAAIFYIKFEKINKEMK